MTTTNLTISKRSWPKRLWSFYFVNKISLNKLLSLHRLACYLFFFIVYVHKATLELLNFKYFILYYLKRENFSILINVINVILNENILENDIYISQLKKLYTQRIVRMNCRCELKLWQILCGKKDGFYAIHVLGFHSSIIARDVRTTPWCTGTRNRPN